MTEDQVRHIIIPDEKIEDLIETHISYVLLTPKHAYKIKKAVQFSFLDFSTIEKRKYYCEQELVLNQRLAKDMYQKVVPVRQRASAFLINIAEGRIVDYTLQMKRMDNSKEMHLLLEKNQVVPKDMDKIVGILVPFHKELPSIHKVLDPGSIKDIFNDIWSIEALVDKALGSEYADIIADAIAFSDRFVESHQAVLALRIERGLIKNCHGDLHTRNIFLEDRATIFDCIEFNAAFREIDILYELAFFCMDLDAEGHEELSLCFMEQYASQYPEVVQEPSDANLFLYYKLYRANVRAKVSALKISQAASDVERATAEAETKKYLDLMKTYFDKLIEL